LTKKGEEVASMTVTQTDAIDIPEDILVNAVSGDSQSEDDGVADFDPQV
jgi:hypothetical protein